MSSSRKPRIILIFLIALCGLFVYSYTARLGEKSRLEAEILAMQTRIEQANLEQAELLEERDRMAQPVYIDGKARALFDHALPGDKVLVIINEPATASAAANLPTPVDEIANPIDYRTFPVWQQWVLFFTTDSFELALQ